MALHYCGPVFKLSLLIGILSLTSAFDLKDLYTEWTTEYFANKYNYEYAEFPIATSDGYHLMIHRITSPQFVDPNLPPVFMMHGLIGSSSNYNFRNVSLAYYMADQGYAVYLGNARGNQYSLEHEYLSPVLPLYWAFSWDEIALLDLPTMINHVLKITLQEKVIYIGHSQGTTTFFALASDRPDYVTKTISSAHMLSPVVFMDETKGILGTLGKLSVGFVNPLENYLSAPFLPNTILTKILAEPLCSPDLNICENLLNMMFGPSDNYDHSIMPDYLKTMPAGSSFNQVHHYAQLINYNGFRKFNFGTLVNTLKYKSTRPPDYKLSQVRSNVFLYYGGNDYLSQVVAVDRLMKVVNVTDAHFFPDWSHLDYLCGKDIETKLNPLIYNNIQKSNEI